MGETSRISVRALVEFVLRSGDIDLLSGAGSFSPRRALEGTRLHQKLQKVQMMDESLQYRKEVPLSREVDLGFMTLLVYGRADGIFTQADGVECIDEIKSTSLELRSLQEDQYPLHWAQAKCYGYFYMEEKKGLEAKEDSETGFPDSDSSHEPAASAAQKIHIRLSYIHTETEKVRTFTRVYSYDELKADFDQLIAALRPWLLFEASWQTRRNENMASLSFPYEAFREGQRTMSAYIYRTIENKGRIFLQAPTGIGKTISALFPALKKLGEGKCSKIFYLTAKNMGQGAALQAIEHLREISGLRLKTVQISARDRICFLEKRSCSAKACPYAKGHYDRVGEAVLETLENTDYLSSEVIAAIAEKKRVCPFEFSLDLALFADLIIADYNYAFDPQASLKRFFQDGSEEYVLLVDEAHNLIDRSRDMFSASLSLKSIRQLRKQVPKKSVLYKAAGKVIKLFQDARKRAAEDASGSPFIRFPDQDPQELYLALWSFSEAMRDYLENPVREDSGQQSLYVPDESSGQEDPDQSAETAGAEEAKEIYFSTLSCLRILDAQDEGYLSYLAPEGKDLVFHLFCIDPSNQLCERYDRVRSVVLFSATLMPIDYYKRLLGRTEDLAISLPSPFPPQNRKVLIAPLPMTYQKRSQSIPAIVRMIHQTIGAREGKYIAFFPSFAFLEQTLQLYGTTYPEDPLLIQSRQMSTEDRDRFLAAFKDAKGPLLGFCVMGGMFSEGIDLIGEQLIGAIVVSVGIPQIGLERDLIRDHLNQLDGSAGHGYEYAYQFPGFCKVLQSAGRVIRSETDRGVILLMDERFAQARYTKMFPQEWNNAELVNETSLPGVLDSFWREMSDT